MDLLKRVHLPEGQFKAADDLRRVRRRPFDLGAQDESKDQHQRNQQRAQNSGRKDGDVLFQE